jgi:DNA-binding LytR/AlgR family response regulator
MNPTALIAEDEPILAQALATLLKRLWPELTLLPSAQDGTQALERALADLPDVCFLDIQMPERNGLEVAEALAEQWPQDRPLPRIVFVTAYDEYAVAAFERAAVDYVLKPVQADRLAKTCTRLQERLRWQISHMPVAEGSASEDAHHDHDHESDIEDQQDEDSALLSAVRAMTVSQRHADGQGTQQQAPLRLIQVAVGQNLQMIPVQEVLYFEAADKYVRVVTRQAQAAQTELLIRTPLRELIPRLDAEQFWQIHRSVVVNVTAIDSVSRQHGKLRVHVHGRTETLEVSRMYAPLFRAM